MKSFTGGIHLGKRLNMMHCDHHFYAPYMLTELGGGGGGGGGGGALLSVSTFDLTHLCLCT